MNTDENSDNPEAIIIEPTAQEMAEGLTKVQSCLPYWKETPALLVIKPELGLIVSVVGYEDDHIGFTLRLVVKEKLIAPAAFDTVELEVGCVWNQPYMSFNKNMISAPYSFYLQFGSEGVAEARQIASEYVSPESGLTDPSVLNLLRS